MALPYYMPPSIPIGAGVNTISSQELTQIYKQHNIETMAYLRNRPYPPPPGSYNFTPIPFKPYYTSPMDGFLKPQNLLHSFPYSHAPPKLIFPISPAPLRPLPYAGSTQSYQSQLQQVAKRAKATDARGNAESKRRKQSEVVKPRSPVNIVVDKLPSENSPPADRTIIHVDDEPRNLKISPPLSGARMNPLFVGQNSSIGNNLSLNSDATYLQELLANPGPGQKYITKIRSLVEGEQGGDNKQKEKIVPHNSNSNEITKKRKRNNSDTNVASANVVAPTSAPVTAPISNTTSVPAADAEPEKVPNITYHDPDPNPQSYYNDYWEIGTNGTFITKSLYDTIPWQSSAETTKTLIRHYFNNYTLATQTLDGEYPLNAHIIADIINLVVVNCHVEKDSVREIITAICAEEAYKQHQSMLAHDFE